MLKLRVTFIMHANMNNDELIALCKCNMKLQFNEYIKITKNILTQTY